MMAKRTWSEASDGAQALTVCFYLVTAKEASIG
jgi:hypothetical protein